MYSLFRFVEVEVSKDVVDVLRQCLYMYPKKYTFIYPFMNTEFNKRVIVEVVGKTISK